VTASLQTNERITPVIVYQLTWCNKQEDLNLHQYRCKNLTLQKIIKIHKYVLAYCCVYDVKKSYVTQIDVLLLSFKFLG
jgi:hypothetical protein